MPDSAIINPLQELHTRPWLQLTPPFECLHYAFTDIADDDAFAQQISTFLDAGASDLIPQHQAYIRHKNADFIFTMERHTEFIGISLIFPERSADDQRNRLISFMESLAANCLVKLTIKAVHTEHHPDLISNAIKQKMPIGAYVGDKAGLTCGNFTPDDQGFFQFMLYDFSLSKGQIGRQIQRSHELVNYTALALRALTPARMTTPLLNQQESALARISKQMAQQTADSDKNTDDDQQLDALMQQLNNSSAEIERLVAVNNYQFSAAKAYDALVWARIKSMRETKAGGLQTIHSFMQRRFSPAMRTIESVDRRQSDLADRSRRIGALMRTMIDHGLQKQNATLLESVNRRMQLQLHVQSVVEGLSVIAISYYSVGLVHYAIGALSKLDLFQGLGINMDDKLITAALIPPIMVGVWYFLKRMRSKIKISHD